MKHIKLTLIAVAAFISICAAHADEPKFEGDLARNACFGRGIAPGLELQAREWVEKQRLILEAERKAKSFDAEECRGLDHGSFTQSIAEYFDSHRLGNCVAKRDTVKGCDDITCYGYASGTCHVPTTGKLAESASAKEAEGAAIGAAAGAIAAAAVEATAADIAAHAAVPNAR